MKAILTRFAALIVSTLLLSSCVPPQPPPLAFAPPHWSDITPTQLVFKGNTTTWTAPLEANEALLNATKLRKTLNLYTVSPNTGNLGSLISQIRMANDNAEGQVLGMTGLGGIHGRAFLDVAERALLQSGAFDTTHTVVISVSGQITAYKFTRAQGDPNRGTGELEVITYITSHKVPHGNAPSPPGSRQTEAYKWKVHVENNGFEVRQKSLANPMDPFPGTLPFTQAMIDRINTLGFQYKLWAKGTDIKIDAIERKAGNSPNWVLLPKMNPMYKRLYAESPDNCIDMMFVHEPPATLDGLGPPFYCLGRCENPLIVNTGE